MTHQSRRFCQTLTISTTVLLSSCSGPSSPPFEPSPTVRRVEITPGTVALEYSGVDTTLVASAYGASDQVISGKIFTWSSLNTSVATVDASGRVTAMAVGTARIVAATGGVADTAQIVVASQSFFVATNGTDTNAGTRNAPWRTIGFALRQLRAGQTLLVRGGTYQENIQNPEIETGRSDARILVAGYPGERAIIQGLLWLTNPSYWTFRGINVTWSAANDATDHMVKMTNGVSWIYEDSELWGARSFAGLLVFGSIPGQPANWVIRRNCVHDVWTDPIHHGNGDHNLYINTGAAGGPGLIERNILFNAPNGQNIKLGLGSSDPQPGDGSANVMIRYNTMYGSLKNLMLADQTHHITVERNIIVESIEDYAIRAYRLTGANNVFRNNVFGDFRQLQLGDEGFNLVTDGGGNHFPRNPAFDGVGCNLLRPSDPVSSAYGRYAP